MKKVICFIVIFGLFITPVFARIIVSGGLQIEGGKSEITLKSGQKKYLYVSNSYWKYPIFRGLTYASEKASVAWVDRHGWVHASLPGSTKIYIGHKDGNAGSITVHVDGKSKISRSAFLVLFVIFLASLLLFGCFGIRCFERK